MSEGSGLPQLPESSGIARMEGNSWRCSGRLQHLSCDLQGNARGRCWTFCWLERMLFGRHCQRGSSMACFLSPPWFHVSDSQWQQGTVLKGESVMSFLVSDPAG